MRADTPYQFAAAMIAVITLPSCTPTRASPMPERSETPRVTVEEPPRVEASPRALSSSFERGTNHAHIHRFGRGYGSPTSTRELTELHALGVNAIALTPYAFQPKALNSALVPIRDPTLSDAHLKDEIAHARTIGMRVVVKPHIWGGDFSSGEWHGTIRQDNDADRHSWWESYRTYILHHAALAGDARAEAFVVGTELVSMTNGQSEKWRALIRDVRTVFPGTVSYAAHFDRELDDVAFWDALDVIGVCSYFPLRAPDDASVDDLVTAWQPAKIRLDALHQKHQKPIVFYEVGFRAAVGSHRTPWAYEGGVDDDNTQARAYEATFRALHATPWWRGVYWWKTFTSPSDASERGDAVSFSFRGRAAERILSSWFLAR